MRKLIAWSLAASLVCISSTAMATIIDGPIVSPINGHQYYLLSQNTWPASENEAETLGATLATIRSQTENQWVYDTFAGFGGTLHGLWIGLNDPSQDQQGGSHAANFSWVSGETATYRNWASGEPNNNNGTQFATYIYPNVGQHPTKWDDYYLNTDTSFATNPNFGVYGVAEVVPEPDSLLLALIAILALWSIKRRKWMGLDASLSV